MKTEKYIGCMLGAAIGDALGKQNEGQSREDVLREGYVIDYGRVKAGCPGEKLRAGQYTDDTEQMLVLARSIIRCEGFDIIDFATSIAKWGEEALNDPERKPLVGPSSSKAIARLNAGTNWKESGSDIPSCGSSTRAAPIGLFYDDLLEVEKNAALSSIPTHRSAASVAGAVAVAVGVRCAIKEMKCFEIVKETIARASKYDIGLGRRLERAYRLRMEEPENVFAELGTSYLVYETVPSAFYCFMRHFESLENAIIEAVNTGGDTDSIACITGALCGALHGIAFPDKWIKGLENKETIEELACMIFKIRRR